MKPDDEQVLISMRVRDAAQIVPGSSQGKCKDCGEAVWRAPSSPPEIKIICTRCAFDIDIFSGGAELQPPTDAQLAEVDAWRKSKLQ